MLFRYRGVVNVVGVVVAAVMGISVEWSEEEVVCDPCVHGRERGAASCHPHISHASGEEYE